VTKGLSPKVELFVRIACLGNSPITAVCLALHVTVGEFQGQKLPHVLTVIQELSRLVLLPARVVQQVHFLQRLHLKIVVAAMVVNTPQGQAAFVPVVI